MLLKSADIKSEFKETLLDLAVTITHAYPEETLIHFVSQILTIPDIGEFMAQRMYLVKSMDRALMALVSGHLNLAAVIAAIGDEEQDRLFLIANLLYYYHEMSSDESIVSGQKEGELWQFCIVENLA